MERGVPELNKGRETGKYGKIPPKVIGLWKLDDDGKMAKWDEEEVSTAEETKRLAAQVRRMSVDDDED